MVSGVVLGMIAGIVIGVVSSGCIVAVVIGSNKTKGE